jgi:hypothetical protein
LQTLIDATLYKQVEAALNEVIHHRWALEESPSPRGDAIEDDIARCERAEAEIDKALTAIGNALAEAEELSAEPYDPDAARDARIERELA